MLEHKDKPPKLQPQPLPLLQLVPLPQLLVMVEIVMFLSMHMIQQSVIVMVDFLIVKLNLVI
jgi:hypothetical protein